MVGDNNVVTTLHLRSVHCNIETEIFVTPVCDMLYTCVMCGTGSPMTVCDSDVTGAGTDMAPITLHHAMLTCARADTCPADHILSQNYILHFTYFISDIKCLIWN